MPLFGRPLTTKKNKKSKQPEGFMCDSCQSFIEQQKFDTTIKICPKCKFHFRLTAQERIFIMSDSFEEINKDIKSVDFLEFEGYKKNIKDKVKSLNVNDAVITGIATLKENTYALAVMDFRFMGASMGSVVGEKITRLVEMATDKKLPVIIVSASGGARMQEGTTSLMQMAKTSAALQRHKEKKLSFISFLTHPTYGGVTASFASLGDINISEPKALIGFAGLRVIKNTIKANLPKGFQEAEFLQNHGLIDRIIDRENLKRELSLLLEYLS